jgi:anaerobic ribonucleoside-triphosphate reductase activating protein
MLGKYNSIIYNDTANAPGISVSVYLQGCPHKCEGCFNPETWDFNAGEKFTIKILSDIFNNKINANGIKRKLCILGGEPLAPQNLFSTMHLVKAAKMTKTPCYIWTGYLYEDLLEKAKTNATIALILGTADFLIDGPFKLNERDVTLKMRGSRNQRVWDLKNKIDITNNF